MRKRLFGAAAILAAALPLQASGAQIVTPPATVPGTVTITGVDVATVNAPTGSPLTRETVLPAEGAGLSLGYARGETIDAAFVTRQFERNRLIGQPVSTAQLIDMVQLINAALLRQGYVNSGLLLDPAVEVTDGAPLKLRLIFGRLGTADGSTSGVAIDWGKAGRRGLDEGYITARMPAAAQVPVNAADIERDFRLLSEDPTIRSVRADLRPLGPAGEAQLSLAIDAALPYDLYVTVANNRTPSVGGERAALGGSARNLLVGSDLFAFEVGRTSGVTDAVASYALPIFDDDLRLNVRAGLNNAAVIDPALLALDISARDRFVEGGLAYTLSERPLIPTATGGWTSARALTVGASILHRRTRTFLFGLPFSFTPGSVRGRAEYTALRGSIDFVDRDPTQALTASLIGTLGLEGTRSDVPGLPQPPKNFRVILGQVNYARRLTDDRLELRARVTGQWTDKILYTAERFSIGGSNTVRGYRESLLLADRGVVGSVELAQPFSLSGRQRPNAGVDLGSFTASVFVDGGWTDNVGPADPVPRWIASVGASLLWTPSDALTARVTFGQALRDAAVVGGRDLQDRGFQFLVTVRPLELFRS
jgi:hemolysin activation/secretion protein